MSNHINIGFTGEFPYPIDSRMQVQTVVELDLIAIKYNRMRVFVEDTDSDWRYYPEDVGNEWHELLYDTSWVQAALDNKIDKNTPIVAGTHMRISYDESGLVLGGTSASIGNLDDVIIGAPANTYILAWSDTLGAFTSIAPFDRLQQERTATITVGGISAGDVFAVGTLFENLWTQLITGTITPPVTLDPPTNVAATVVDEVATITWTKAVDATYYKIFEGSTELASVGDVDTVNISLSVGDHDIYVRAYNATLASIPSNTVTVTIAQQLPLDQPLNLAIVPNSITFTSVVLTFDTVLNASGYKVFNNGVWFENKIIQNNEIVSGLTKGTNYNFTVVATDNTNIHPDSVESNNVAVTTQDYFSTYHGKNTSGNIPAEAEILVGLNEKEDTSSIYVFNPDTLSTEYMWLAVHKGQSAVFGNWEDSGDSNNAGTIGTTSGFMRRVGEVTVNTDIYTIYMYGWSSEFTRDIIFT